MKSLVLYSSRTGNTKKVAEAVFEVLPDPKDICPADVAPPMDEYDFVALGFWVDKGMPDALAQACFGLVRGKRVGLFGTLGAWPDSEHARDCLRKARALLSDDNEILGEFLCQGRIDPKIIEVMRRVASDAHPMTPERMDRIQAAESHPDEQDLAEARAAFRDMLSRIEEEAPCGK